jgi:hypothetical protein
MTYNSLCARETRRHDQKTVVAPALPSLAHLNRGNHAAGPLRRQQSKPWLQQLVRSLVQALQDHAQQDWLYRSCADQRTARKLNVDRTSGAYRCCTQEASISIPHPADIATGTNPADADAEPRQLGVFEGGCHLNT